MAGRGRWIETIASAHGWYVMVGPLAVCSHHGPVHVHARSDRRHPDRLPRHPVDPALTLDEVVARVDALCERLGRAPRLAELLEVLR